MAQIIGRGTPVKVDALTGCMISTETESGMSQRMCKVAILPK